MSRIEWAEVRPNQKFVSHHNLYVVERTYGSFWRASTPTETVMFNSQSEAKSFCQLHETRALEAA